MTSGLEFKLEGGFGYPRAVQRTDRWVSTCVLMLVQALPFIGVHEFTIVVDMK